MTTARDIIIYQGQAFALSLPYAGTSGRGQRMHIRTATAAATVVQILTYNGDANARVLFDGTDAIDITIGASFSGLWLVGADRVEWVYDIEDYSLADDDDVVITHRGKCVVYGNRTRADDVTPSAQMPSGDGRYVRFDGEQTLTTEQKLQARENIGAGSGGSGSGDVVGPASATDGALAVFDGTTGKLLAEGAVTGAAVAAHMAGSTGEHGISSLGSSLISAPTQSDARNVLNLGTISTVSGGTGIATALAANVGSNGAPVIQGGGLGTPSSGDLSNVSGLPPSGIANAGATLGQTITWNGSAWAPETPSGASPAGSGAEIQYRVDASTFGASPLSRIDANTLAQRNGTTAQALRVNNTYTDDSNQAYIELNAGAAGDWFQIRAVTVGTAADNYGVALSPSGTGALSAHVPDSTAAGGNARGENAIDWQTARTAATQVASQSYSTISGGRSNTASGQYATVAGGNFSAASAERSAVGGGEFNSASGSFSTIAGGYLNTASGSFSVAGGHSSTTRGLQGAVSHSSSPRSAAGDAQVIWQQVRRTTAATTTIQLSANGSAPASTTVMVLPNNSGGQFEARVSAYQSTGCGGWKIEGTGYRGANAAATVIQGATTITAFGIVAGIGAPTVDVVADTTLGALVIQITPANTTSTYWVGKLELVQVA